MTGPTVDAESGRFKKFFACGRVWRACGVSYSLSRSSVTTFNDNTRNVFQSLAFRTGVEGQNQLNGIITSVITPSFSLSSLDRGVGPHNGKDLNIALQVAGAGGNVKYISPQFSYRQFFPMKGLKVNRAGHNVLAYRTQFTYITGFGGSVAPPTNRYYSGGEADVRGFDIRSISPYTFIANKVLFNLTNPDGTTVPRDPTNPTLGTVQIPLPIYRLVSVGGDTSFTANLEYRIPIVNQVTFAFFTDFNMTFDVNPNQLLQSVAGQSQLNAPLYGCPVLTNGACSGGALAGSTPGFPLFSTQLTTVPNTNYVPRMSNGAELQVILPIVNAPFRIYYAYNPLRLYRDLPQQLATDPQTFRDLFPRANPACVPTALVPCALSGAGEFSYDQAIQFYGADYQLREPRKTFRLTVSTTF